MAKLISDEKMKFSYVLDGNQAQKDLNDLEKSTRKLTEENKGLLLQKKLLEKQNKKDSDEYKLLTKTIAENNLVIKANKAQMSELQKEIGITGLTMNQLQRRVNELKTNLRNLVPGTELYNKYKKELGEVSDRMKELSGNAKEAKSSLGAIADGFNRYAALAATVIATLTGVVLSIQKVIDFNGKLADATSDVMKTTGMTKREVDELSKSFGLLKTRTDRIRLLKIAEEGGRIGVVKEEIADFVNVMNKAAVALSDSFTGGVSEVASKLGKLKFLFKETKDMSVDEAYNKIGSSINDLGAAGVASEVNIAEFATRVGSLPDKLKPSIAQTLALGAAFEESGLEAEVSSRAYNIFLKQASTESGKFAKVMGITQKEVEKMINTDPLEFFLHFSEGLRGMDATEIAKTLDYLGVNADGANKALGAVANNSERFREQMDLSNNSFALGTSLIKEYDIKNNNFAATLEKVKKYVVGWYSSDTFVLWLTDAVNWIAIFIGAVDDTDGSMAKWKANMMAVVKIIAVLIATTVSYTATNKLLWLWTNRNTEATALYNLVQKAKAIQLGITRFALLAYEVVLGLVTGNLQRVTAATIAFNVATKSTPWGLIIGLITAAAGAYFAFSESAEKAAEKQITFASQLKQLSRDTSAATAETKANVTSLMTVVKDEAVTFGSRKKAYEELIRISPVFNGFLKDEKFNIEGLVIVYQDYLKALDQVAYAKSFASLNVGNIKKQIAAQQELYLAEKQMAEASKAYDDYAKKTSGANFGNRDLELYRKLIGDRETAKEAVKLAKANLQDANKLVEDTNKFRNNQISVLETNIKLREKQLLDLETKYGADVAKKSSGYRQIALKLEADRQALEKLIPKGTTGDPKSNYNVPDGKTDVAKKDPNKTQAEINKERLDNERKFQDELLKLKRQGQDDEIALMKDGYAKEELLEVRRYQREIEELEKQRVHTDEMAKIDADISKAKKNGDIKYYDFLVGQKRVWAKRNEQIDEQINSIEAGKLSIHQMRLGIIQEKGAQQQLEKIDQKYKREKTIRETAFNLELAEVTTLVQAKEKLKTTHRKDELDNLKNLDAAKKLLQEDFNNKELEQDKEFLNRLIKNLETIMNAKTFEGIDLDLLTPEMRERFTKQIEEAANLHSKLVEATSGKNQPKNTKGFTDPELEAKDNAARELFQSQNGVDILGYTPEQWQTAYSHLDTFWERMNAGVMVIGALQNAWSQYGALVEAKEKVQLQNNQTANNVKKERLKKLLDSGFMTQKTYNKAVEGLDREYDKKKAEIELKQAKRNRTIALMEIVANTAKGVMSVMSTGGGTNYADFGVSAALLSALVIATGAIQAATVLKTPLPSAKGYEKGLYNDRTMREQDGKVFKTTWGGKARSGEVKKPTVFMAGEKGVEMIIDNKAWSQMSSPVKDALMRELRGVRGFEEGLYNEATKRYEVPVSSKTDSSSGSSDTSRILEMALKILSENTQVMREIKEQGIIAKVSNKDLRSMKNLKDGMKEYEKLNQKSAK